MKEQEKQEKATEQVAEENATAATAAEAEAEAAAETEAEVTAEAAAEATEAAPSEAAHGLSPAAEEAFAHFLSVLTPEERQVLVGVISRLRAYEAAQAEAARAAEEAACLREMESEPAFAGISERAEALRALIGSVSWLRELPTRDRLAAACYIDRGMRLHTPTPQEKLEGLLSDPALMRALAERQAAVRAARARQTPPIAPGMGQAPAAPVASPRSLGEAKRAAKNILRVK